MQKWKRILSSLIALCLTLTLLGGLTALTQKKDSYAKHAEFFDADAPYDAFFIGSSHMMNGVFPMELWEHTGIASYNWAQAGHPPPAAYWVMRLALDYAQPKLMVIDCYGMHFDAKTTGVFGLMHISMDSFPLSLNKVRAVRDLLDDPCMSEETNEGERRSAFNLLWTFPVFHSRWSQLTAEDFRPQKNYTRGAIANNGLVSGAPGRDDSEAGRVFDTVGVAYLRRAIEECQSRGIRVLLTFVPLFADAEQRAAAQYVETLAAEYGVDYLNFTELDAVNYSVDFGDSAGHLNSAGARKVTAYIGNYITERYGLSDHRGEDGYQSWDRDLALYTEKKNEALRAQEDLYRYLMLLERDSVDALLLVNDTALFEDPIAAELLRELGVETDKIRPGTGTILIRNGGESAAISDGIRPEDAFEGDLRVVVTRGGEEIDRVDFRYVYDPERGAIAQTGAVR